MYYIGGGGGGGFHDHLSGGGGRRMIYLSEKLIFSARRAFSPADLSRRREKNTTLLLDSPMKIPEVSAQPGSIYHRTGLRL